VKWKFGIFCSVCLLGAHLGEARAQSVLDWARGRGLAGAQPFDDSIVLPGESLRPWIDRDRGFAFLGISTGHDRWRLPGVRRLDNDLRLDGELALASDSYEPVVGMWGTSSRLGLRFALGGSSDNAHSEIAGELATGALLTLDKRGSGAIARISGSGAAVLEPGSSAVLANVGVPFGFSVTKVRWHGELLLWPSLGWASIGHNGEHRGSGPLFIGAMARLGTRTTWLEANHTRAAVEADVTSTRMSVCTQFEPITFCTDGWWLRVHDILDNDPGAYTRVGVRIGFGSTVWRTAESLVRTFQ
jgi:hypothetical protein